MKKAIYKVPQMDCPSEEQLIRMKLAPLQNVQSLRFDIPGRKLDVFFEGEIEKIDEELRELKLGSSLLSVEVTTESNTNETHEKERNLLKIVLIINAFFFLLEITIGFIANSMGLVADSLDMLADAIVYSLSLFVVGKAIQKKKNIAKISGYFQMMLAILGVTEVIRRFLGTGDIPSYKSMILISVLALIGNLASLLLLRRSKSQEAHMQASIIFTSNDVLANLGVIVAGILVYLTSSKLPDLIIGSIVFFLVAKGSLRILKIAK